MEHLASFAILTALVLLAPTLSNLTRIPVVVVEMLLGAGASYIGFFTDNHSVKSIAEIGFLILMFLCGLEVNLKSFRELRGKLLRRIVIYFAFLYSVSASVVFYFKLPPIYIVAFPIMGVGMIMALIKEYGKDRPWLSLALQVGVLGELLSICALVILNGFYSYGLSPKLYQTLGVLLLFLLLIALAFQVFKVLFWWFPSLKLVILPENDSNNQDLRFGAMLFFTFVSLVMFLDLEVALGAFIAGMIIATFFGTRHTLHHKLNTLGFGFFVPFFFVHVGTTLDLKALFSDINIFKQALYIVGSMFCIRFCGAFFAFRTHFKNPKHLILYSLSDSMPLTFLVATATLGLSLKIITEQIYYAFVLGAMIEGILFMIGIKLIFNLWKQSPSER